MTSPSSDNLQLVYNARIWQSAGDDLTWMTFNTGSGYVTAVGRHDPPLDKFPPDRRRDVSGRRIIPGLHESHIHLTYLGRQLQWLDLKGCQSIEQLQQRVRSVAAQRPAATWIVGCGWEQHLLGRFPTRHDLDAACSDRPVHLLRSCRHASVENSVALKLAGLILWVYRKRAGSWQARGARNCKGVWSEVSSGVQRRTPWWGGHLCPEAVRVR